MNKTEEIINKLGGPINVAANLQPRITEITVRGWKRSGSIPVKYWPSLLLMALEVGVSLTAEQLMFAHIDSPLSAGEYGRQERLRKAAQKNAGAKPKTSSPFKRRLQKCAEFAAKNVGNLL